VSGIANFRSSAVKSADVEYERRILRKVRPSLIKPPNESLVVARQSSATETPQPCLS